MIVLTVDYKSPNAANLFVHSVRNTGFALVENHMINHELMDQVFNEWEKFFSLPEKEKSKYLFKRDFDTVQSGFFPQEISETAKGFTAKDLKEFFHYYPCAGSLPERIGPATQKLRHELITMAEVLLSWLEEGLPIDIKQQLTIPLSEMVDKQYQTLLRILHYPPLKDDYPQGSVRAAAHEDINLITLLLSPSAPGLQALDKKGVWHDVPCKKNTITINIGDMLQECSKNYYHATKHRVINPEGQASRKSRYSIPLFLHPRDEVVLSNKYTAKRYRDERLQELGLL